MKEETRPISNDKSSRFLVSSTAARVGALLLYRTIGTTRTDFLTKPLAPLTHSVLYFIQAQRPRVFFAYVNIYLNDFTSKAAARQFVIRALYLNYVFFPSTLLTCWAIYGFRLAMLCFIILRHIYIVQLLSLLLCKVGPLTYMSATYRLELNSVRKINRGGICKTNFSYNPNDWLYPGCAPVMTHDCSWTSLPALTSS